MLPSLDIITTARNSIALEDAFEILVNIADRKFIRGNYAQAEYDAWYDQAVEAYNKKDAEFHPQPALQSYSDFIEG